MTIETKFGVYYLDGEVKDFRFNTNMTMAEKLSFVTLVSDIVVSKESYNDLLLDLAFDYALVKFLTDIDTEYLMDKNKYTLINNIEEFLDKSDVIDVLYKNVDDTLIKELKDTVSKNIEYKTGVHKNPVFESLSRLLNTLESKFKNVEIDSMIDVINNFSDKNGNVTPEALIDAYTKTEYFKENFKSNK